MRGCTLRAVPVCLLVVACGCFPLQPKEDGPPSPTRVYWQRAGEILAQKPAGQDMPSMVRLVRTQTDALRELPSEGVDPDLVAAVGTVVTYEAEVLRRAEMADNDPARLRASKELAQSFANANRNAAEAKKRLRALQPTLSSRHGGGFAPLDG